MGRPIAHTEFVTTRDWPGHLYVQGGRDGLVITGSGPHGPGSYVTPYFFEAFGDGSFVRGEGDTMAAAEAAAWAKLSKYRACEHARTHGRHDWHARGYINGAGFCRSCGMFGVGVFTGADLGQLCRVCSAGTTWAQYSDAAYWADGWPRDDRAGPDADRYWYCQVHDPFRTHLDQQRARRADDPRPG